MVETTRKDEKVERLKQDEREMKRKRYRGLIFFDSDLILLILRKKRIGVSTLKGDCPCLVCLFRSENKVN